MEINNDAPVSDADRRQAEAKKLVLTPLHADVVPEPLPESEAVAHNVNGPAIANIPSDIEHEDTVLQPSRGIADGFDEPDLDRTTATKFIIGTFVALSISAVAIIFVVVR